MKKIIYAVALIWISGACGTSNKTSLNHTEVSNTDSLAPVPNDSCLVTPQQVLKDSNITIPIVSLDNKTVSDLINAELDLEKISGYSMKELEEQKKEQKEGGMQGLVSVSYEVEKNHDYVLSIRCYMEACGAYCSNWNTERSFDLKTGRLIKIEDLIQPSSIDALIKICNQKLNAQVDAAKEEHKKDMSRDDMEIYEGLAFVKENLSNFIIDDEGITFHYFFDFPHVMAFAEPNPYITVTKDELKDMLIKHQYGL
jgi:hypothetical protein